MPSIGYLYVLKFWEISIFFGHFTIRYFSSSSWVYYIFWISFIYWRNCLLIQIENEEIKLFLFAGIIILSIINSRESTRKLLEWMILQQNSRIQSKWLSNLLIMNTWRKLSGKQSFIIIVSKNIKCPGIILTEDMKTLYTENNKTPEKERKNFPCL